MFQNTIMFQNENFTVIICFKIKINVIISGSRWFGRRNKFRAPKEALYTLSETRTGEEESEIQ